MDPSVYYDDGWNSGNPNDGQDDYPDREEWPDQDPDDPELDDDYMGPGPGDNGVTIIWGGEDGDPASYTDIIVNMDFDNDSICYGADC